MALIYRSLLEIDDAAFARDAPDLFLGWLRWKFGDDTLELPSDGETAEADAAEITSVAGGQTDPRPPRVPGPQSRRG